MNESSHFRSQEIDVLQSRQTLTFYAKKRGENPDTLTLKNDGEYYYVSKLNVKLKIKVIC